MEHLEDEILNNGVSGMKKIIQFLVSLGKALSGPGISSKEMTVKWDGKPAVFAGNDPKTGKFFVGTKSIFNKNPKLIKQLSDIALYEYKGQLASKMAIAFSELQKLDIENVLQGDMMFTQNDLESTEVDGIQYITFQPNTIVYAVPVDSDLGKKMNKAKMGIVWHTTYTGDTLQGMTASFGANISSLSKPTTVWMDDLSLIHI